MMAATNRGVVPDSSGFGAISGTIGHPFFISKSVLDMTKTLAIPVLNREMLSNLKMLVLI